MSFFDIFCKTIPKAQAIGGYLFFVVSMPMFAQVETLHEIGIELKQQEDQTTLSLDFSPSTTVQILRLVKPELREHKFEDFNPYIGLVGLYFKEIIYLKINGQKVELTHTDGNLNALNSTTNYAIEGAVGQIQDFELLIQSFDFDQEAVFNLQVIEASGKRWQCKLNKENKICSKSQLANKDEDRADLQAAAKELIENSDEDKLAWWYFLPLLLLLPILYLTFRPQKGL